MQIFPKKPLAIDEQIKLLHSRGLLIADFERAKLYLTNISYYHFTPYFKYFQTGDDRFRDKVEFENILELYVFDKKLRLISLDVLERIEMSIKCRLIYFLSVDGEKDWLNEPKYFINPKATEEVLSKIRDSREKYITNFYEKYEGNPPPWMILETLSFGKCVHLFSCLGADWKKRISVSYGLDKNYKLCEKWLRCLSGLRNFCAHHSRVWNRVFISEVQVRSYDQFTEIFKQTKPNLLFAYLIPLQFFIQQMNPTSEWLNQLENLITSCKVIDLDSMGFPNNWKGLLADIKIKRK